MQRVTITLDDELLAQLDRHAKQRGYQNRSEAIRDLTRAGLKETGHGIDQNAESVAAVIYVYDHRVRELSKRLADSFHDHHDISLATLHVHLTEESCVEVSVLRGRGRDVQHFAEHITAERGVQHGTVVALPVSLRHAGRK